MCSVTRTRDEVAHCLELARSGMNATEVSRLTAIPRPTVRDWLHGRIPRDRSLGGESGASKAACARCGWSHDHASLPSEYVYLLGIYLGDGCISTHPRSVFRLRVTLDAKYPGIIAEVAEAVRVVMPANAVGIATLPKNCVQVSSYSKSWPCLFPQHGLGKKCERPIFLADWQRTLVGGQPELLLRGLVHSDGCRFINTGRGGWRQPRYTFCNLSPGIRSIFCEACDLLGLAWTYAKPKTLYVSRKVDVARMDEFIGPKR